MEKTDTERNLVQTVRNYLNLSGTVQQMPYEKRLSLKRLHLEAMKEACEKSERSGFTLVEMLVAVALIVVMMILFSSIFQMATSALAQQKGFSENDQRARLVETLLRNDLNGSPIDKNNGNQPRSFRTFKLLIPWAQDETVPPVDPISHAPAALGDRIGYFAISENDPNDDTDDVLSLTVAIPDTASERFYGKAAILSDRNGNQPQNQPEFDDIVGSPNNAGSSTVAEVAYFLRHGTLYRRVLLIRKPNVSTPPPDAQPADANDDNLSLAAYQTTPFWRDFDYSAFYDFGLGEAWFHGIDLSRQDSLSINCTTSLSNPVFRFGYDNTPKSTSYGQPREHDSNGLSIGRFTQRETSDPAFLYPGVVSQASPHPMNAATNLSLTATGIVTLPGPKIAAGIRAGEDALMTNVLKFDIKVWDPKASFGPDGAPGVAGVNDDDPDNLLPLVPNPNNDDYLIGFTDFDANGNPDVRELGSAGSDDGAFVDIGHSGRFGCYNALSSANIYFSPGLASSNRTTLVSSLSQNQQATSTYWQSQWPNGSPTNINRFDTWSPSLDLNSDSVSDLPPYGPVPVLDLIAIGQNYKANPPPGMPWPYRWYSAGYFPIGLGPDGHPGRANFDDDGNQVMAQISPTKQVTTDDAREFGWPGTDDFLPLSAIQIKITFFDTTSKQLREMTFVQSLLYTP